MFSDARDLRGFLQDSNGKRIGSDPWNLPRRFEFKRILWDSLRFSVTFWDVQSLYRIFQEYKKENLQILQDFCGDWESSWILSKLELEGSSTVSFRNASLALIEHDSGFFQPRWDRWDWQRSFYILDILELLGIAEFDWKELGWPSHKLQRDSSIWRRSSDSCATKVTSLLLRM